MTRGLFSIAWKRCLAGASIWFYDGGQLFVWRGWWNRWERSDERQGKRAAQTGHAMCCRILTLGPSLFFAELSSRLLHNAWLCRKNLAAAALACSPHTCGLHLDMAILPILFACLAVTALFESCGNMGMHEGMQYFVSVIGGSFVVLSCPSSGVLAGFAAVPAFCDSSGLSLGMEITHPS